MSSSPKRDADAVRYIVLRKLASSFRHTLMGELQTIQFFAELSARLMQKGGDEAKLRECVEKIPQATSAAVDNCRSVIEWLRPNEGEITSLGDAVGQCVKLAGDDWNMRGTTAIVDLPASASDAPVSKSAARELVATSLFVLTDLHRGPLDIEVVGRPADERLELRLRARAADRTSPFLPNIVYHTLTWDDVATLAGAHGVRASCTNGTIALQFMRAQGAAA
jgi:hypothetical protein